MSNLNCDNCSGEVEVSEGEFTCTKCGLVMNTEVQPDESMF